MENYCFIAGNRKEEIPSALALISIFWLVALMAVIQQPYWTRSHHVVISAILMLLIIVNVVSFSFRSESHFGVVYCIISELNQRRCFLSCCSGCQSWQISRGGRLSGASCPPRPPLLLGSSTTPSPCTWETTTWTASLTPWSSCATPVGGEWHTDP